MPNRIGKINDPQQKEKTPKKPSLLGTNLANLLKVKTIITLSVVFTFCFLSIVGRIGITEFMTVATAVITYYFTKDNGREK